MNHNTAVVLLHAFPLDATMWEDQRAFLEDRGGHVLALNLPGFGGRPLVEGGLDAFADSVIAECDARGIERAVFVGLSMGGYVAMRIADRYPSRIRGLVLADTRAGPDDDAGRKKRSAQAARARTEGCGWLAEAMLPALLGETSRQERLQVVKRVQAIIDRADGKGVARALEAMRERPDSLAALAAIEAPILTIAGDEDKLTPPAEAESITSTVRNGSMVVIPKAGHLSNLECPGPFNEALDTFLRELG